MSCSSFMQACIQCKPHRCHYGACPPCRLICDGEYPCGHKCKLRCHGPIPPPIPKFTLKRKKKKSNYQTEPTPGPPCPPCPELVFRSCVGHHIGAERMMVCSNRAEFSCENLCGNPLPCGNHYCTYVCHALTRHISKSDGISRGESCEKCTLPCEKERHPACPHPCLLPCHQGECALQLIKRSCHCGAMVHVFECIYFNSCQKKSKLLFVHAEVLVIESCQTVHIYAQRRVIPVHVLHLTSALKRSLFAVDAKP